MSDDEDFDPELDLIDRYDEMVQTQVSTLESLDDKAAKTLRIIALLLGILFSGLSLLVAAPPGGNSIPDPTPLHIAVTGIGIICLFVSITFASVTFLSSVFRYGPSVALGSVMSKNEVERQDYIDRLLSGYSEAVGENRRVVKANAKRFRRSLTSLLCGLVLVAEGVTLTAFQLTGGDTVLIVFLTVLGLFALIDYLERKEYLTLDRKDETDE